MSGRSRWPGKGVNISVVAVSSCHGSFRWGFDVKCMDKRKGTSHILVRTMYWRTTADCGVEIVLLMVVKGSLQEPLK
ncbi:hypothetical protein L2E82_31470 [Cichorium intybus]|uniref:Uncharacterized protein n=1 Tax=Cichorium intybus TaxID=13427 RepID=A0ACB9D2Z1_CICIN|nr:hypothetical protein L2E82_31470 [Cichorium intybus]